MSAHLPPEESELPPDTKLLPRNWGRFSCDWLSPKGQPLDTSENPTFWNPEWHKFLDSNGSHVWGNVEDYWPRRLLHIPSMVSVLRSGSSTYGDTVRPKYSILSYTWGRWEVSRADVPAYGPEPPHLPVKGVTWQIPRISEGHFTVHTFQKVINQLGRLGETEWAWVDIACIDQEDDLVKMDEVGRQASIFKNASRAFVWLCHTSGSFISEAFSTMFTYIDRLEEMHEDYEPTNVEVNLAGLHELIDSLFGDPWFSSLWTLQEFTLRPEARILDMNAECRRTPQDEYNDESATTHTTTDQGPSYSDQSMGDLCMLLRTITSEMESFAALWSGQYGKARPGDTVKQSMAKSIKARTRSVGCGIDGSLEFNNANAMYGAARFRKTTREEDRIYAISQVFNLRVGRVVRPQDYSQTLDSLVEEFGFAINARSPLHGQVFVHTGSPPSHGKTWCITEASEVPGEVQNINSPVEVTSSVTQIGDELGGVCLEGRCSSFWDFHAACSNAKEFVDFKLYLDEHARRLVDPERRLHDLMPYLSLEDCTAHLSGVEDRFEPQSELAVILLGTSAPTIGLFGHAHGPWELVEGLPLAPRSYCGVLLQKIEIDPPSVLGKITTEMDAYQRLGFCTWLGPELLCDDTIASKALLGRDRVLEGLGWAPERSRTTRVNAWCTVCQYAQDLDRSFSNHSRVRFM